jgi:cholesterol oxidase
MANKYDVIIIGSGFGGAVSACRLAESGARVLVLERGRRWSQDQYPRKPTDPWLYKHSAPHKLNGWLDLRLFKGMAVAMGAGVGGGSLCYSSVMMELDPERFKSGGWPQEIDYAEMKPYYDKVRTMLGVGEIPARQQTHRSKLLQQAANRLGYGDRFSSVPLALTFDQEYSYDLPDPLDTKHSKPFVNRQGQTQGTCIHLGNCDIGCDVRAKNTLDLNYIAWAERHGADIRPLHLVRYLAPIQGGYKVVFNRIVDGRLVPGEECAERVILAAGSLGSTEILLRSRDEAKTLPNISSRLGQHWTGNANFLTPDKYPGPTQVHQGIGPTITAGLNFLDGSLQGQRFYIEDDGFPNIFLNALTAKLQPWWINADTALGRLIHRTSARLFGPVLHRGLSEKNPTDHVMVWLGEGLDASDGQLRLGRSWIKPWTKELKLQWDIARSQAVIDTIVATHKRLSESVGGNLQIPLYWSLFKALLTVHPLGGCKVAENRDDGVVDHRGAVFDYENLFIADGAMLPGAVGRNPSMTIAAMAERVAALILK